MNPFKYPVRLIDHPGNDFTGPLPGDKVFDLGSPRSCKHGNDPNHVCCRQPSEPKTFEVSLEKTFEDGAQTSKAHAAQTAAHDFGRKHLESETNSVEDGDYVTVYVRDPEGVITAWVVTAHVEPTYSAVPGAL